MAQNQGYFQGQPGQQQQQYSPVYQQPPQNIYQQLGKPQPQRTHSYDQQQAQQLVPQGFQFAPQQQQQYQAPYTLSQTPYALSQTPYQPSHTPFSAPIAPVQAPYQQPQTPYQQQYVQQTLVPYSMQPQLQPAYQQPQQQHQQQQQQHMLPNQQPMKQQQQLVPIQQPMQHQQRQQVPVSVQQPMQVQRSYLQQHTQKPLQQHVQQPIQQSIQQPVQQPVQQHAYQQQQITHQPPQTSYSNQSSWRPASSKPPPISPSASLAKQARAPMAILPPPASAPAPMLSRAPTSSQTPAPQTSGRRPLPQPAPGVNAQPPTLPPTPSTAARRQAAPVLPSLNLNTSSGPFTSSLFSPNPASATPSAVSPAGGSASPTRSNSRPLPTPAGAPGKRATVDMGKLPHGASATVPSIGPISNAVAQATANWPPQNRTPSPTKAVSGLPAPPSIAERSASQGVGLPGYAPDSPTKRRASPPRFQGNGHAQSASESSAGGAGSPVKQTFARPSGISPSTSTSSADVNNRNTGDDGSSATPKKFTPMWRRTIPEMPAPAWGYAAGMVPEPHPKPNPPPVEAAPAPAPVPVVVDKGKGKEKTPGKLAKFLGGKKKSPTPAAAPIPPRPAITTAPSASAVPKTLNSQYPLVNPQGQGPDQYQQQQQRYASWQPQIQPAQQTQAHAQAQQYAVAQNVGGHQRTAAAHPQAQRVAGPMQPMPLHANHVHAEEEEETEEDDEDEEEEETGEEEEETEEEETEESEVDRRAVVHTRQYSHQSHTQAQAQTPKKQRQAPRAAHEYEYEEEAEQEETPRKHMSTPKKGALRPKGSSPVYAANYTADASPRRIAEKRAAIEREMERERAREAAPKLRLRPKSGAGTRSRALQEAEAEEEEERVMMSAGKRRGVLREVALAGDGPSRSTSAFAVSSRRTGGGHERSRSAFGERDMVKHRREPGEVRQARRPGSAILSGERRTRRIYDDDDDEEEAYATLAYDDSEDEEEEEEEEVQYKKSAKRGVPAHGARERDWDHREVVQHRRHESGPQYGNRNPAPPMNRRTKSGSGVNRRYEDDDFDEDDEVDDVEYRPSPRRIASNTKGDRKNREPEVQNEFRRPSGLPHPPTLGREPSDHEQPKGQRVNSSRTGKVKSVPLKQEKYVNQELHPRRSPPEEKADFTRQFTKMQINSGRTDSRASNVTDGWPADLPRLPRTPGSVATPDKGPNGGAGYFDVNPPANQSTSSANSYRRETPKSVHAPSRNNLNLDDPPPRATVTRTPSPGPGGGFTFKRELPQPQGPPQVHPTSQNYPVTADKVSQQLARRRSLYTAPPQPVYQGQQAPTQRPQTQVYGNDSPHSQGQHFTNQLGHPPFNNTRMQQTPAPPPTVGIESPHPVGGREKMADIPKMEEDSNDGSDNERSMIPRITFDSPHRQNSTNTPSIPSINIDSSPSVNIPTINVESSSAQNDSGSSPRKQHFDQGPKIQVYEVPGISVSGPQFSDHQGGPTITINEPEDNRSNHAQGRQQRPPSQSQMGHNSGQRTGGLVCGGCHGSIIGRIVSAMGQRYHPACFKCTVCNELLEHVSSYEHEGRPYCHLDYHETFAPRCFSCKTAIVEEQFISLDDPALGKRAYHTQHFFCAECGDPFLAPSGSLPTDSRGEFALSGDGEFEGFTVYKGHPYCESCHVRLRLPKCKRCKRSIRDNDEAVEALGGKWCWSCFVCASCEKPFNDPSFFERGGQPYCEHCFSVMLRNEV